jgi:hypothetical protein
MKFQIQITALLLATECAANAASFFVSPAGGDSDPGIQDKPFASLARAQQAARSVAGKEPVTINLRDGTYYLPQTFVFNAADSGSQQSPVVYQAMPGEEVGLSGGTRLDIQWHPFTNGIYRASVPISGTWDSTVQFDQLFINGRRRQLARYPNFDPNQHILGGYMADAFSRERAARWANPKGGYIHALHYKLWGDFHYVITGKDKQGDVNLTKAAGKTTSKRRFIGTIVMWKIYLKSLTRRTNGSMTRKPGCFISIRPTALTSPKPRLKSSACAT